MNHERRVTYVVRDWANYICSRLDILDKPKRDEVFDIMLRATKAAVEIEAMPIISHQRPMFCKKPSDIGDLFTLEEFQATCAAGGFIDYDGYGHAAHQGEDGIMVDDRFAIKPSEADEVPTGTTHIIWFNR